MHDNRCRSTYDCDKLSQHEGAADDDQPSSGNGTRTY